MKEELADECDYAREASFLRKFAQPSFLGNDARFKVPWVWDGSTERVLVMERVGGLSVGGNVVETMSQNDRNEVPYISLRSTDLTFTVRCTDCHKDYRPLLEGTFCLPRHANRPKLDQLLVEL